MVTILWILPQYLHKPVMILNVSDNMTWHWRCCIMHTSLACVPPSLTISPLPPRPFPASGWERQLLSIWDQWEPGFTQRIATAPLFSKGNIQMLSPITTEKSAYTEFPDTTPLSVLLLNKKIPSMQLWCLIGSLNTKIEGKAMFLPTAYQEHFNNQEDSDQL